MEGLKFGCKLGTMVDMGLCIGWLDGGFSEGMAYSQSETLGDSNSMNAGTSVLVGLALGWLDG